MSGTYSNLLYHLVFSTKNRRPLITEPIEQRLHKYLGGIIRNQKGSLLEINGMPDHVHLLLKLKPIHFLPDLVRDVKANSSAWLNEQLKFHKFGWQDGYAVFTVSQSQCEKVTKYIAGQKKHHLRQDYRTELLEMLHKNQVEFDERHLWK